MPIYCTITPAHRLPEALLLRDSLHAAQGDVDFRLLLLEHPAVVRRLRPHIPGAVVLGPDEVGCPSWLHLAFGLDEDGLQRSLKPALLRTLLREGSVIYLEPGMQVLSSLADVEEMVGRGAVVATPRVCRPASGQDFAATMRSVLLRGQFDLGFFGIGEGPGNEALSAFLQEAVAANAFCAAPGEPPGATVDEFWSAACVSLAAHFVVLRSPRYHLFRSRPCQHALTWEGGVAMTEDGPLALLDLAGRLPAPGTPLVAQGALRRLVIAYLAQLTESPHRRFGAEAYSFATYANFSPIPMEHRRAFAALSPPDRRGIENPFADPGLIGEIASRSRAVRLDPARCAELERRLNTLPHSLIGHAGRAMDLMLPGSRDRAYHLLQQISRSHWQVRSQVKARFKQALGQRG